MKSQIISMSMVERYYFDLFLQASDSINSFCSSNVFFFFNFTSDIASILFLQASDSVNSSCYRNIFF